MSELRYFCDERRHLVCLPYSVDNLHAMARELRIHRCWFHDGSYAHYDIPKRRVEEVKARCTVVREREILLIVKGQWPMRTKEPKPNARMVAFIPPNAFVEGQGWRVSFVVEGEDGHRPTGTWPYDGKPGQTIPWFWGPSYEEACAQAREYNARMGIDEETAFKIVARSHGR